MRINKFKYKEGEGVLIRYEKESKLDKNSLDKYEMTSKDIPSPDLINALQAMDKHLLEICEMNGTEGKITVLSVSLPYGGADNVQGLVITGLRELEHSNSPMVINTPCFWSEAFSDFMEDEGKNLLSDEAVKDLSVLVREVEKYIGGKRAQKEFDFSEEKTA